jgi:FkbM family methyltransferase
MMKAKTLLQGLAQKWGYEIQAYNFLRSHDVRRSKFLQDQKISLVLDVGANVGQYGMSLRRLGYTGKIISFEPVDAVFQSLEQCSKLDQNWIARNEALGDFDGEAEINISDFSQVSSILSATGLAGTNYWKGRTHETTRVQRLDQLGEEIQLNQHRVWLKIDTQGFEEKVLRGATHTLECSNILFLEVELSIQPFYVGEKLFPEMLDYVRDIGFELASMCPVHVDSTRGYVLQYDCIFIRKELLNPELPN